MEIEKEVVEPQQAQEGQEVQGQDNPVEVQSPTPGVENGAEPKTEEVKDSERFDEQGVSYKQRFKEYERKYHQTLERFANYQRVAEPQKDPNEVIDATRGGIKQVINEFSAEEARAEQVFDEVIENLANEKPEILNYKNQIEKELKTITVEKRKEAGLVEAIACAVYGRAKLKEKQDQVKPLVPKKLVNTQRSSSDVLPPSAQGGAGSETKLSDTERDYDFHHRLSEKGFTNEEIHDLFVRSNKRR